MKNHNLSRYKKLLPIKVTVSKKLARMSIFELRVFEEQKLDRVVAS